MSNKIPKIIHQIWIGDPNKMPTEFMETWKMGGWTYMLWNEKAIDIFGLELRDLYDFFYKQKNYHGASDVVRVEVLKRFGGIYIDADTERIEQINDAPFIEASFFAVEANRSRGVKAGQTRIANGIIGSVANHPIIEIYAREMAKAKIPEEVLPPWSTIGGSMLTSVIYDFMGGPRQMAKSGVMILEPHTFYPFDSAGNPSRTKGKTYARHIWGTTHNIYGKI